MMGVIFFLFLLTRWGVTLRGWGIFGGILSGSQAVETDFGGYGSVFLDSRLACFAVEKVEGYYFTW